MLFQTRAWTIDVENMPPNKEVVLTLEQFWGMMAILREYRVIGFDFETTGTEWYKHAAGVGIALGVMQADGTVRAWYVPYRHLTGEPQLSVEVIGPPIAELLADRGVMKVAHNLKFDMHMARREGWKVEGPLYDTMIAARLYDENKRMALKFRAKHDLGIEDADEWEQQLHDITVDNAKRLGLGIKKYLSLYGYGEVPIKICGFYACFDIDFTLQLWAKYEHFGVSTKYPRVWPNEMRLVEVICDMEEAGLPIDIPYMLDLKERARQEQERVGNDLRQAMGGVSFNWGSDDEVREYLISYLKLPLWRQTDTYQISVDKAALSEFKTRSPVIPLLLEWRDFDKILTTYTDSILDKLDANGMLHGEFQQVGTNTGRLSCKKPNFQNFPNDDDDRAMKYSGKHLEDGGFDPFSVRRAFVMRDQRTVRLHMDYSQIELRVLAYYSGDPVLTNSYLQGEDVHTRTSLEVFGTDAKHMRRIAKVINFGLSYCMSHYGLSRNANIPEAEAEKYMSTFFEKYAGIAAFRKVFWQQARENGCEFQNLWGRPRRVPYLNSEVLKSRAASERKSIGTLIQGTAAELTRESLTRLDDWFRAESLPAMIVNTIHDDIAVDVDVSALAYVARGMKERMEAFPEFAPIPVIVDGEWTNTNWAEKKPLPL